MAEDSTVRSSEIARARYHVLLVNRRGHELRTIEPDYVLHIVGICPECMERVVCADGEIGIIADESASESVAGVRRLRRHFIENAPRQASAELE